MFYVFTLVGLATSWSIEKSPMVDITPGNRSPGISEPNELCHKVSADAGAVCAGDCEFEFMNCLMDCRTDPVCVAKCSREDITCTEQCPCYSECFDGCPCDTFESDYCISCEMSNSWEYEQCDKQQKLELNICVSNCPPFEQSCQTSCFLEYTTRLELCPCMKGCPAGCPCPEYECPEHITTTTATTTIQTTVPSNDIHLLIFNPLRDNPNPLAPQVKVSLFFESTVPHESYNEVSLQTPPSYDQSRKYMCSFSLKDRMYLVGGMENKDEAWDQRFASYRVHDKWIEELTDLPFPFEDGRCLTLQNPLNNYDAYTLMCAPEQLKDLGSERTDCWIFDGVWYRKTENGTNDDHMMGEMAHFNHSAVIIGGYYNYDGSTEVYHPTTETWEIRNTYREFKTIHYFSAVGLYNSVYVFGGVAKGFSAKRDVYYMEEDRWGELKWYQYPYHLSKGRNGHISIGKGNSIVHIGGGTTDLKLEAWRLQEDEYTFKVYESRVVMDFWSYYPNAFIVGENDYLE